MLKGANCRQVLIQCLVCRPSLLRDEDLITIMMTSEGADAVIARCTADDY